jgi:hypothetical protein
VVVDDVAKWVEQLGEQQLDSESAGEAAHHDVPALASASTGI